MICSVERCDSTMAARGWCNKHYRRWREHGDPTYVTPRVRNTSACSIEGCDLTVIARGWCQNHYQLWRHHGTTEGSQRVIPTARERFWALVDRDGPAAVAWDGSPLPEPCWLWTPVPGANGYGVISVHNRSTYAHRLSYELNVGPIPRGLTIDHLCMVQTCVNPTHLEPVTRAENTRRELFRRYNPMEATA